MGSWLMPGHNSGTPVASGQPRLPPSSLTVPKRRQFPPKGLFATIVFWRVVVALLVMVAVRPEPLAMAPPLLATLFAKVLFVTVRVPLLEMPPPELAPSLFE